MYIPRAQSTTLPSSETNQRVLVLIICSYVMIIIMEIGSVAILAHPPTADPADLISIRPIKRKLLRPGARQCDGSPAEAIFKFPP